MLDRESSRTMGRFALSLAMILAWHLVIRRATGETTLASMMAVAALCSAMIAAWLGDRPCAGKLNRWDECASYLGLAALAHGFG